MLIISLVLLLFAINRSKGNMAWPISVGAIVGVLVAVTSVWRQRLPEPRVENGSVYVTGRIDWWSIGQSPMNQFGLYESKGSQKYDFNLRLVHVVLDPGGIEIEAANMGASRRRVAWTDLEAITIYTGPLRHPILQAAGSSGQELWIEIASTNVAQSFLASVLPASDRQP
ncbi:MAG: hypothetical protein GY926_01675 [bacterium]|nr:hypothetical protein [bacterium]